jgi:hypothetical protein
MSEERYTEADLRAYWKKEARHVASFQVFKQAFLMRGNVLDKETEEEIAEIKRKNALKFKFRMLVKKIFS